VNDALELVGRLEGVYLYEWFLEEVHRKLKSYIYTSEEACIIMNNKDVDCLYC